MALPVDPTFTLVVLVLAVVLFEAWFVFQGRPRGPKDPGANHVHQGVEVSRHEVAGRTVVVYECRICQMHFNGETG